MINERKILEPTQKSCVRKAIQIAEAVNFAFVAYVIALSGLSFCSHINSKKITSQEQLEQIIEIERKKIDPNNKAIIRGVFVEDSEARSDITAENKYTLTVGGFFADVSGVRHELYHILDGHFKNIKPGSVNTDYIDYLFKHEPKAIAYQAFGLKL